MGGYEIGISGLHAAQIGLDVVGNNIANAATEGYHRQKSELRPMDDVFTNGHQIGQGVEVTDIVRLANKLLDDEIVNQESLLAQIEKELDALTTMESAFAELTTSALSTAMDTFFNAFHDLAAEPEDVNMQGLVISAAQSLSNQIRNLGSIITDMEDLTYSEAVTTVDDINLIADQIAEMNKRIHSLTVRGNEVSNLLDQRGQLITQLGNLVGIKTYEKDNNVIDIVVGDTTIVLGAHTTDLELGLVANGSNYDMGITPVGELQFKTDVNGGLLGGLVSLKNAIIRGISDKLDTFARTIITKTNDLHVQGVGTNGSFDRLTGWTMTVNDVADFVPPVTAGNVYIRVTDSSGNVTRTAVAVDPATDTLTTMAAKFAVIPGLDLNTSVNSGRLQIVANSGYTFDFIPGALAAPSDYPSGALAGAGAAANEAPPSIRISGNYGGTTNQTYTCTISTTPPGGTLAIGSGSMEATIVDGSGVTVATLNIGEGYESGTLLEFDNGLKVSFGSNGSSPGYLNDAEDFEMLALADSDTSGFLSAVGINTFFSGVDATSMAVVSDVVNDGTLIGVYRNVEQAVGANALKIGQIGDTAYSDLNNLSPKDYYRDLVTDVGAQISTTSIRQENAHGIWRNLNEQRSEVSGVDINDEAAKMLVYERMFQAMAKYMNTISQSLDTVMGLMS